MKSIAVRIDDITTARLDNLAKSTGRNKSFYINQAIKKYLEEKEDYLLGLAVLENEEPEYDLADVKTMLKEGK